MTNKKLLRLLKKGLKKYPYVGGIATKSRNGIAPNGKMAWDGAIKIK